MAGAGSLGLVCLFFLTGCALSRPDGPHPVSSSNPILALYQGPLDHLHAVRSGVCGMHPSCSSYAAQAMERQPFFEAWFSVFDRLMRCGRDLEHSNIRWIATPQGPKVWDPVP